MKHYIKELISSSAGKFITVSFVKNDGTYRKINGRIGVRYKGMPAETINRTQAGKEYLRVWSVADRGYRNISPDTILSVAANGKVVYNRI